MTWLEEWVYYFEYEYSHVHHRWKDFEKQMDLREKSLRKVVVRKLSLVVACRRQWPLYVSLKEDESLRYENWNQLLFKDGQRERMIMHDIGGGPGVHFWRAAKKGSAPQSMTTYIDTMTYYQ